MSTKKDQQEKAIDTKGDSYGNMSSMQVCMETNYYKICGTMSGLQANNAIRLLFRSL